jgi:SAM-dependent methyltransferase
MSAIVHLSASARDHDPQGWVESWRSFDIAPSAITVQRQAFEEAGHKGEFIAQDFLSWQSGAHSFDLAYEQTCLCAVGRDQRQAYEEAMWDALRPGGKLFALFMQTGGRGGTQRDERHLHAWPLGLG